MDRQAISKVYEKNSSVKPLSLAIYNTIYSSIIEGYLNSGDRITIDGLAKLFFTSRTPVREAIHLLRSDGIVDYEQSVGYFIRIYTQKDCLDLFEVLHILQVSAVVSAAESISESYLLMLEKNVTNCHKEMSNKDFFYCNRDFHMIIAKSTNNDFLADTIERVYSRLFLFDFAKNPKLNKEVSIEQHKLLLAALRKHDADEALKIHVEHAKVTGNYQNWALATTDSHYSQDII